MIAVIADDFTGAAEVAGAAFAAGYEAELLTLAAGADPGDSPAGEAELQDAAASDLAIPTDTDVVVVDTNTRSAASDHAAAIVTRTADAVRRAGPEWIYKKIDSLLRGHVALEVEAVRSVFELDDAVIVPANPAAGRTIESGRFFVAGVPLAESELADDPEYPRRTSEAAALLGGAVPNAASDDDLERLAAGRDDRTLAAGSAAFFEAMLKVRPPASTTGARRADTRPAETREEGSTTVLFVCGSLQAWRNGRGEEAVRHGVPVFTLPEHLLRPDADEEDVARFAARLGGHALVAIGRADSLEHAAPAAFADLLARVAARRMSTYDSLYVEGGATAAAVARRMGWRRLSVVARPAPGVVTMAPAAGGPRVTTKVGSYPWPESVWPAR